MDILVLVNDKTEESELIGVTSLFDRANINVSLCSINGKDYIIGSHKTKICVNLQFNKNLKIYDALYLPGGIGVLDILKLDDVLEYIKAYFKKDLPMFAICAAPSIFGHLGILDNKHFTCYPGYEKNMPSGIHKNIGVVKDGNIITAKSVNYATPFGLEIIKLLKGKDTAEAVTKQICRD